MRALPWYLGTATVVVLVAAIIVVRQAEQAGRSARIAGILAGWGEAVPGGLAAQARADHLGTWAGGLFILAGLLAVFTVIAVLTRPRPQRAPQDV